MNANVPPGYKQTEVGVIPEDWDFVRLTTVAELESGHTPSRRQPRYWGGDIPWVSLHDTEALNQKEIYITIQTVTQEGINNSSARLLPKGTVIFSRTATVGKTTALGREMATKPRLRKLHLWAESLQSLSSLFIPSYDRRMEEIYGGQYSQYCIHARLPRFARTSAFTNRTTSHCRGIERCGCPHRILGATPRQKAPHQTRRHARIAHRQEAATGI